MEIDVPAMPKSPPKETKKPFETVPEQSREIVPPVTETTVVRPVGNKQRSPELNVGTEMELEQTASEISNIGNFSAETANITVSHGPHS